MKRRFADIADHRDQRRQCPGVQRRVRLSALIDQVAGLCRALQLRGDIPARVDCADAGEVLFYVCNSLFMEFVADDAMALASLKRRMARQIRLVFEGLLR